MTLTTKWIRYGDQNQYSGFFAVPERAAGPLPGIIVIQEIWGVDDHIQDVTERFASAGYAALAPDLYAASGVRRPGLEAESINRARQFLDTLPPGAWGSPEAREKGLAALPPAEQKLVSDTLQRVFGGTANLEGYLANVHAAAEFMRQSLEVCHGAKVGAIGFCMGGALSARLACQDPELSAAVIFYGSSPSNEQIAGIRCPLLGVYGEADKRITDQVPEFAAAMAKQGKPFSYDIYPEAPHAFFNDTRPSYRADAARTAFVRTLSFFADNLG